MKNIIELGEDGSVPATIITIGPKHVVIRLRRGGEHLCAIGDVPAEFLLEGQPISLRHDDDGFVSSIEQRFPEPPTPELQRKIDNALAWVDRI